MFRIALAGSLLVVNLLSAGCGRSPASDAPGRGDGGFLAVGGGPAPAALFTNGGFEQGALTGWTATSYLNNTGPLCADAGDCADFPPASEAALRFSDGGAVTTSAVEGDGGAALSALLPIFAADGGSTLRYPFFGSWAALVNDKSSSSTAWGTPHASNSNLLSQTYQTTFSDIDPADGNIHVRFVLAPALENGSHAPSQQPFYYVQVFNTTRGTTLYSNYAYANQPGFPWQKSLKGLTGNEVDYTDWLLIDVAPGGAGLAAGDTIRADIIASGCQPGGHAGEVVVDGFGSFVPGLTVVATAPGQVNISTPITYQYTVRNGGTGAGTNVTVSQPILAGTSFASLSAPAGATCSAPAAGATSGTVVCNLGTVNTAATESFSITLNGPAAAGDLPDGLYTVSADGVAPLLGSKVDTTVVTSATYADLGISINDGIAAIGWGGSTTYAVTISNAGPAASPNASISAPLPANGASASWSCAAASGGATVGAASGTGGLSTSANLPAASSIVCSYVLQLSAGSGSGTLNFVGTVSQSGPVDPRAANNSASDQDQIGTLVTLTVQDDPQGSGTGSVVSSPAAINCTGSGPTCSASFVSGVQITLTGSGVAGSQFSSWSGITCAGGSTANQCNFLTPASDTTITARFDVLSFAITQSSSGQGTLSCPASGAQGTSPVCTVAANSGSTLSSLVDNGVNVTAQVASGSYVINDIQTEHTVVASFVLGDGQGCSAGSACGSGLCVDAVCCNSACAGECQACNLAGSVGTCATVTAGAPRGGRAACAGGASVCAGTCDGASATACGYPSASTQCLAASCANGLETFAVGCAGTGSCPAASTQSCGAYACGATACNTTCAADGDCSGTNYCNPSHQCVAPCASDSDCGSSAFCSASRCVAKRGDGSACAAIDQCASGFCADAVCCNSACTGQCAACDVSGSAGTCTELLSGQPHGARAACASDGSACGGSCNGSSSTACGFPSSSTQCRAPACANGVATAAASCDGAGSCLALVATSCGRFNCDAAADACITTCAADADCTSGNFCAAGVCTAKGTAGSATVCSADDQCAGGHCADGFCCDTACTGQCQACDVGGSAGTCSPLPAGSAPHVGHSACADDGSGCGGACDGTATLACAYPGSQTNCRGGACTGDTATLAAGCNGAGACPAPQTQVCAPYICGANACAGNCANDSGCLSGNWCSGGVCIPTLAPGAACGATDQCASGFCTDGVCCDTACAGQCAACDVAGSVGTCSPAPAGAAPQSGRNACSTDGSGCGGACDGLLTTACSYPASETSCRAGSCANGLAVMAAACNGAGACPAERQVSCGHYVCSGDACGGDCSADVNCASGSFCAAGVCTPQQTPGAACAAADQCASGFCTDGVCCDSTCTGQCQACDVRGSAGTCSPTAAGTAPHGVRPVCADDGSGCGGTCDGTDALACAYPDVGTACRGASCSADVATQAAGCDSAGACSALQTQACAPYVCGAIDCKSTCAADPDCASGSYCSGQSCLPVLAAGAACTATDQCASGFCTDGVCCDTACAGQCAACDVSGSAGTCTELTSGQPHGARPACASDASACGGSCDGASATACDYPGGQTSCRAAACVSGVATAPASCAGNGSCPAIVTTACGRFACDAAADACVAVCSSDADCSTGNYCAAGVCAPKGASGSATTCIANDQCASGHCADGFCCDSACGGQCQACDVSGSAGTCAPVPANSAPHPGHAACADDGSGCGGACDGTRVLGCAYPTSSVSCRGGSCAAGVATLRAGCNGAGACPAAQTQACAPYLCGANACAGNCLGDADCASGNWCSGGVCAATLAPGAACSAADQCASGFCTDGVCCGSLCDGQCAACNLPGSAGSCSPVPAGGAPEGARAACVSDGSGCGGVCDGALTSACAYPASATVCRDASCSAGVATLAASCDGAGHCPAAQTQSCGAFACGGAACNGDCRADADCAPGNFCAAGVCVPARPSGAACGAADQCGSGACVDGVCCDSACAGQCEACDVPAHVGSCTPVAGAPRGARSACASDGSPCGGACDGAEPLACAYPSGATACRAPACQDGVATAAAVCAGTGACPAPEEISCAGLACDGTVCSTPCSEDSQCASGASCVAGACVANGTPGTWRLSGSGGCTSSGAGDLWPLSGLLLFAAWRLLRRRARRAAWTLFALALAAPLTAKAQTATPVNTQLVVDRFQPGAGAYDVLSVGAAQTAPSLELHLSAFFDYANQPLRLIAVDQPSQQIALLRYQSMLYLGASIGLFDRFELGLVVPMLVAEGASQSPVLGAAIATAGSGVGDVRLVPKAKLYDGGRLRLAAALPFTLPTGAGHAYLSQGTATFSPELRLETNERWLPVQVTANAGVALRSDRALVDLQLSNAFTYGLAGQLPFQLGAQKLAALATLAGEVGLQHGGDVERPLELMAALRLSTPLNVSFTAGGGPGISDGYGTPRLRLFAGVSLDPSPRSAAAPAPASCLLAQDIWLRTPAGEAILCPINAMAESGAPIRIVRIEGPAHGTVVRDGDGAVQYLPAKGYAGRDELVLILTDGAGRVARQNVRVEVLAPPPAPLAPVPVAAPVVAPVVASVPAPLPPAPAAPERVLRDGHLALLTHVQFATGKDQILPRSLPLLDRVVQVLRDNPDFARVRIDGHTDNVGKAPYNRKLSQRRAESVRRYLVQQGIAPARLETRGFGPDQPLESNDTEKGREQNRRVEFVIIGGPGP